MRDHLLPALLLLALALAAHPALGQAPPKVTLYLGDTLVRVNVSVDTSKSITCPNRDGFIGVSDREGRNFASSSPSFTVDLGYTKGDLADLQRMRQMRLGAYHCIYLADGQVAAYSFVLSEEPSAEIIPNSDMKRIGTGPGEDLFEPYCRLQAADSNDLIWEIYRDSTGLFEQYSTGRMLSLTYTALSREHGNGMTIFRCFNRQSPEEIQYNWAMYSDNLQIRPVRASNYESTPLPYNVRFQSSITLECHGNGSTTAIKQPNWMFKPEGSEVYAPVIEDVPALDIKFLTTLSTLTIQRMLPKYSGFYKCDKDSINHAVQLKVNYGDVIIKDYSKGIYPLTTDNYITCEIPEKTMNSEATYTLYRTGMPPLSMKGATSSDGFTTSFDSLGNLMIRFQKRSDVENARLVCTFFGGSDFTTIKTVLPKLTLSDYRSQPSYFFLTCKKDREFGSNSDLTIYKLNLDGSIGPPMTSRVPSTVIETRFYESRPSSKLFTEFICVTTYDGQQLRSNVLAFGTPEVAVDLYVEGEKNPPSRVFLGGRDVTLECHFSKVPFGRNVLPSAVSLFKDERKLALSQEALNATAFRYVIRNAGPSDNGNYRCDYTFAGLYRAGVSLTGNFKSPSSSLQFCTGSQFVCDSTCKDVSLMCDKRQDCIDGADERPEYCEKCEPNEVKCEAHNGRSPDKRCVLKHWLCDGQDDCGNGFDENLSLHSKWCFKDTACRSCRPEETCCPSSDKCIQRNYECDRETDCDGGTEEMKCSPSQCLRIIDPGSRRVEQKRVGDTFNLTCTAIGMDRPTINWRRNWAALPKDGVSEVNEVIGREPVGDYTVLGTLQFVRLTKDMSGIYNCEAVNNCKRELSYEIDLRVSD